MKGAARLVNGDMHMYLGHCDRAVSMTLGLRRPRRFSRAEGRNKYKILSKSFVEVNISDLNYIQSPHCVHNTQF